MNTLGDTVYRTKWRQASLATALRNGLVLEKICQVDRSANKTIKSPYGSQPTTVVQALAGTYTPAAYTITDDTLTVAYEFIVSEHIFDFEETLSNFDLFSSRQDEMNYSVLAKIDQYGLNVMLADGTGTYTTPVGGFTTASNANAIIAGLSGSVMGYADSYNGLYLVLENTDITGILQAQMSNGFSFADSALRNGFMTNYGGIEIYVVRSGTFTNTDIGDFTAQNSGHRLFGVKNTCTFAEPQGIKFEEKSVSGKTGKELVCYGYVAVKVWAPKAALTVDITLA